MGGAFFGSLTGLTGFGRGAAGCAVSGLRWCGTSNSVSTCGALARFRSSPGSNRVITPYSPSYPATRRTAPRRSRPIASRRISPPAWPMSSSGTVRRMSSSAPRAATRWFSCDSTVLDFAPTPWISPRISCSWMRCSTWPSRWWPAGRSARSSTRLSTPTVSGLPHSGQRPPCSRVRSGSQFTPQARCPSAWYLPSSGKNSSVPARPRPSRTAK